jgi:hypothetical protein
MKLILLTMVLSSFLTATNPALAQTWNLTSANTNTPWGSIACSADGTKVAVTVANGGIYVSRNSGAWTLSGAPNTNTSWASIVSSADGNKLAAIAYYCGFVYTSADGGTTWTSNHVTNLGLDFLAASADGTRLFATSGSSNVVYISTNTGVTWSQTCLPVAPYGVRIASSADGTKLAAATYEAIFTSTNSGTTWQMSGAPTNQFWNSIASSADGSKLVAGAYSAVFGVSEDSVFTSADSGATWTSNNLPIPGSVPLVTSSADGTRLVAVAEDFSVARVGEIFVSNDSGNTWTEAKAPFASWISIASSADGCKLFGTAQSAPFGLLDGNQNGGIYISQTIPIPTLNLAHLSGNHLTLSWIVPSIGFILQKNSGLDPNGWTNIQTDSTLNFTNVQLEVPASPTNEHGFYRLKSP